MRRPEKKRASLAAFDETVADHLPAIAAKLPDLIEKLFELADGVRVVDDEGQPAYRRPPDRLAIEYLIDRVLGRPVAAGQPPSEVGTIKIVTLTLPDNGRNPNLTHDLENDSFPSADH